MPRRLVVALLLVPAAASCALSHERGGATSELETADEATLMGCTGMARHEYVEVYAHVSDGWVRVRTGEAIHGIDRADIVRTAAGSPPWSDFATPDDTTTDVDGFFWELGAPGAYRVDAEATFDRRRVRVVGEFDASSRCP